MYGDHRKNYYDLDWKSFNIKSKTGEITGIHRPASYDTMLKTARDLSQGFPHVRVDFYEVGGKPILGEMTFTSSAGFGVYRPADFDYMFGSWFNLPDKHSPYVIGL